MLSERFFRYVLFRCVQNIRGNKTKSQQRLLLIRNRLYLLSFWQSSLYLVCSNWPLQIQDCVQRFTCNADYTGVNNGICSEKQVDVHRLAELVRVLWEWSFHTHAERAEKDFLIKCYALVRCTFDLYSWAFIHHDRATDFANGDDVRLVFWIDCFAERSRIGIELDIIFGRAFYYKNRKNDAG